MLRSWGHRCLVGLLLALVCLGCRSRQDFAFDESVDYVPFNTQIEAPAPSSVQQASFETEVAPPFSLREPDPTDYWPLSLEETIQIALANSQVMRDLGARVLTGPTAVNTIYDPALQQVDPRFGEEAALSAFDAQFATSLFFSRSERAFNNQFFGGGARTLAANRANFVAEINKTAATGTQFAIRNITDYDRNNSPANLFPGAYDTSFQAEFRHPLLQGGGIYFNRIAGPNGRPGFYNGIVIARINTDIALADFEISVRDFLEDVEQTYWQLYFAYRNLDAQIAARDAAAESWRTAKAQFVLGSADRLAESLAREQFYQFQALVENALSGGSVDIPTSVAGTGVYTLERQLRMLMGVAISDGRLIRPTDEPSRAETIFDLEESLQLALQRRAELRRQRWNVKGRELELLAARNLLRARLDLVGQYNWNGFGDQLFGDTNRPNGSAFENLFSGDLQGWQLGLQLSTPIGNRIGHAAVRSAELEVSRAQAVLDEQERHVIKQLMDALAEQDRAFQLTRTNLNRTIAARQRLSAEQAKYEAGEGLLQFVFEAQSRVAEAESEYFRSLVDYNVAVARIHFARGTFLDFLGVNLSEGESCPAAHRAAAKESRRFRPRHLNYCVTIPCPVSAGPYPQDVLPGPEELELLPQPAETPAAPRTEVPAPAADLPPLPPATDEQ